MLACVPPIDNSNQFVAADTLMISHSPVVAKAGQQVTFTAQAPLSMVDFSMDVVINDVVEQTCTESPCSFVGGPYPAYQDATVSFKLILTDNICISELVDPFDTTPCISEDGYYYFGITDGNYNWQGLPYIPARTSDTTDGYEDLVLHMADDYAANGFGFSRFVGHVEDKIYDVFGLQDIIKDNLGKINFWVYTKEATITDCGTPHADIDVDMPWRDTDGVLHELDASDCTAERSRFSAEGRSTKAFLHEAGHAIFDLGDEYCGVTEYFEAAEEPNIWMTEQSCRDEQTSKGRDPDVCFNFCSWNGQDWWGIQALDWSTVMQTGNVGDPWGIEAAERVHYFFDNIAF